MLFTYIDIFVGGDTKEDVSDETERLEKEIENLEDKITRLENEITDLEGDKNIAQSTNQVRSINYTTCNYVLHVLVGGINILL